MKQHTTLIDSLIAMAQSHTPIKASLIYQLSEMGESDATQVREIWDSIPVDRRITLMSRLDAASASTYETDFSALAEIALEDEESEVRSLAIKLLWETERLETIMKFLNMTQNDTSLAVRSSAASVLGRVIYLAETEDFNPPLRQVVENTLTELVRNESSPIDLRCSALESIAYSSDSSVLPLIHSAYTNNAIHVKVSAIVSMGRNGDPQWKKPIMKALNDPELRMCFAAINAAGEMELTSAIPELIELADSDDIELSHAAISALGEIGGSDAYEKLQSMSERVKNTDTLELIEDALDMVSLSLGNFSLHIAGLNDE
jgi:HEAT repeat protein